MTPRAPRDRMNLASRETPPVLMVYFSFFMQRGMFVWLGLLLMWSAWPGIATGVAQGLHVGQNYRIYPSNVTQTEPFIVPHPTNHDILFVSANTINLNNGFISEGVYLTTNRGESWYGSDTCSGAPINFHRGDPGIAIDKDGRLLMVRLGFSPGLYAHYSTNLGQSWSGQRTITTNDQDRATLVSDTQLASAFYGRSYTAWVRFAPPFALFFSSTDDGGQTWRTPAQINNPSLRGQGGELAMGPGGAVYLCWASVINTSPFTEVGAGFAVSTNGGTSWTVNETAFAMNGISGTFPSKGNIRVNGLPRMDVDLSGGARHGWIYVVTTERNLAPAGSDPDIILRKSTDGGVTWSSGVRVNRDVLNNGKTQYFPAVHVDDGGGVNVLYYDDRHTTNDSAGVFLSRSTDGALSWADHRISDHNFKPAAIGGLGQGYQGDNIDLTSVGDTLWPVWMDNSTGIYQLWTVPIRISQLGTSVVDRYVPSSLRLEQNYPNPFNPSTTIQYELTNRDQVLLRVVDMLGREVARLVDAQQPPGRYAVEFNAAGLSGGLYFCQMQTTAGSGHRSMLLLK